MAFRCCDASMGQRNNVYYVILSPNLAILKASTIQSGLCVFVGEI